MKRLFSPPIQLLLWLGSAACLGFAAWNVMQLRLLEEDTSRSSRVSVQIPESLMLTEPAVMTYSRMVQAPLFWPSRAIPVVEVAAAPTVPPVTAPEVPPPPPAQPPVGRLVGIVNVGSNQYALIRTEEKNLSLHIGEQWEGWTLEAIDAKKIVLASGEQKQEVKLIADFAPPAENQQLAQLRKQEQQKQQMAAARQQQAQQAAAPAENIAVPPSLEPAAEQAQGAAAVAANPPPVMSLKEALEARQRLMSSRWGANNSTEAAGGQKANAGAAAPTTANR